MLSAKTSPLNDMDNLAQVEEQLYHLCRRDSNMLATLVSAYLLRCDDDEIQEIQELLNTDNPVSD